MYSKSTGHLTFETDHYLRESEATTHALSLLTPLALSGAALGGSVGAPILTSILLANQVELEASGVRIPFEGRFRVSCNVLSPDIPATNLVAAYHTARTLPPETTERLSRAVLDRSPHPSTLSEATTTPLRSSGRSKDEDMSDEWGSLWTTAHSRIARPDPRARLGRTGYTRRSSSRPSGVTLCRATWWSSSPSN